MFDEGVQAAVNALPKIELHRHLEGSVRLETLVDIARQYSMDVPDGVEALRPLVQVMPGEPRSARHFLSKFRTLRQFYRSREVIRRIAAEVVHDAAADNVRYMELRFTPQALCAESGCTLEEIIPLVCESANAAAASAGITVRYIISMNRHEPVALGERAPEAALHYRAYGVVALDLAGDEENYPARPFYDLFRRARAAGLHVTVHAGEWDGPHNVRDAVLHLGAERIGHGINAVRDPEVVRLLVDRGVTLEVCPSSNVYSGIVATLAQHPLVHLNQHAVPTTINTDDPAVCSVTLSREFLLSMNHLALTLDDVKQHILRAARAAFLTADERATLEAELRARLEVV